MLTIYLACLIFGGILLTISMFSGSSEADTDIDHDLSTDHSFGDTNVDTHLEVHQTDIMHHTASIDKNLNVTDAVKFISFRNIIFFLTFFGLTGTTLQYFLNMNSIFVFALSTIMGGFSAGLGYKFMKYLKESETGTDSSIKQLEGRIGRVLIPLTKTKNGKLLIESQGQYFEIQALLSENSEDETLKKGDEVMILEILNNIAYVIKKDFNF